ncbi:MAG: DUF2332 domain-containing protein [Sphingomonadales bacterium]|nr:DUF2332 domain-containing protein [Sphingomonadales bacterium]
MHMADVDRALEWQADHAAKNSAPGTGRVIRAFLPLIAGDTACGARMRNWPGLSLEDAMPLRLTGGLHNLLLTGADTRLAPVYAGEITDQSAVDALVEAVVRDHDGRLLPWFDGPPQTNEAGRSGGIMAQLLWLARRIGPRFELFELGCSAGINTMLDRFAFNLGGVRAGPADSPITIRPEWKGPQPPSALIEIVAIEGCDVAPIDLADPGQALHLKSYVWPDTPVRLARIDAATAMARQRHPVQHCMDAGAFVARMLAVPQPAGVARVLFHTVVWQYVPPETRAAITQRMAAAGMAATAERPLAWVTVETNRQTFRHELRSRYWPGGGEEVLLGEAHAHGAWIDWYGIE